MTFKVMIHDVLILWREIEIPERCPGFVNDKNDVCGADLTQPGALRVYEYQDQNRRANLTLESVSGDNIDWSEQMPQQGDDSMEVGYCCADCDHEFENGGFIRQEGNAALWAKLEKLMKENTC